MCGRFTITTPSQLLAEHFDAELPPQALRPRYNAAPSQELPVILESDPKQIVMAHWGYPMRIAGHVKEMINFRTESFIKSVTENKPFFQKVVLAHRCLVLADGFYEWQRRKSGKQPFRIVLASRAPFAFAGVYTVRSDKAGREIPHFSIITVEPNELMKPIHNRMPVILERKFEKRWIRPEATWKTLAPMLHPYAPRSMKAYEVSTRVNSPKVDSPIVIEPIPSP